ncbi:MAG: aldolase/citrate lyase family protein, partial [Sphingomicrobium sp.]
MTLDLFDKRTLLFLPASNPRAITHARESDADIVVLDLEDAVKLDDKDSARDAAIEAIAEPWPMPVAIRVNASGTQWHGPDVVAVMHK